VALTVPAVAEEEKATAKDSVEATIPATSTTATSPAPQASATTMTVLTFDYNLPGSEYTLPVTLGNIETTETRNYSFPYPTTFTSQLRPMNSSVIRNNGTSPANVISVMQMISR